MTGIMLLIGVVLAIAIVSGAMRVESKTIRAIAGVFALVVLFIFTALSSIRYVGEDQVGVIVKNFGRDLPQGQILATDGEKGPQASVLGPGWHFWLWPGIYNLEVSPLIQIEAGQVGLLTTTDGLPMSSGNVYAPEWGEDDFGDMQNAEYFLTTGGGYKGPQTSVLTPGKYRINPKLFRVKMVDVTNVPRASVAVIKSNVGSMPPGGIEAGRLVDDDQRGIRRRPLAEGEYYLNTDAYEVTLIATSEILIEFTGSVGDVITRSIKVRTSDAFEFPVDVRIKYVIEPKNAPMVVASLRDDKEGMLKVLQGSLRSIFRNNAQNVKALDYVQQRIQQEQTSKEMLSAEMSKYGITINAVLIADLGDDSERWQALLKTQTDREIALQEQATFQEQQRAAEQKKALTRTVQEAEEEKRLATAMYEVQIAQQDKEKVIIAASAEAESIRIKAEAQAEAYRVIAEQIGKGNAALVELLKIVGEAGINITPRVMVIGQNGGGSGQSAETTALIGTMLDSMMSKQETGKN